MKNKRSITTITNKMKKRKTLKRSNNLPSLRRSSSSLQQGRSPLMSPLQSPERREPPASSKGNSDKREDAMMTLVAATEATAGSTEATTEAATRGAAIKGHTEAAKSGKTALATTPEGRDTMLNRKELL